MSIDKLESGKCDDLRHLDDEDLAVVTGGDNMVLCQVIGSFTGDVFLTTKQQCNAYMRSVQNFHV